MEIHELDPDSMEVCKMVPDEASEARTDRDLIWQSLWSSIMGDDILVMIL